MKICSFDGITSNHMFTVLDPEVVGDDERINEVTDVYIQQGFSWRRGNVDFYTLNDLGMDGEVFWDEDVKISSDAIYAIQVPFVVVGTSGVGISASPLLVNVINMSNVKPFERDQNNPPYDYYNYAYLPIPPGEYALVLEQGFMPDWDRTGYHGDDEENAGKSQWGRLWFNLEAIVEPEILRSGSRDLRLCPVYLDPPYPLRLDAKPL